MSLIWELVEIQPPIAGRKSSPGGGPRPIDPTPIVELRCSINGRYLNPQMPGFVLHHFACQVDLFRLPDAPMSESRMGSSYYAPDGTFDANKQPVYALFYTDYPERMYQCEAVIGNHLLLESSKETHLLHRQTVAQAYELPDNGKVVFPFPNMGVLQTGQYLLRYSVYNSKSQQLLAKCFGRPFTISTVNRFPGLQPTTGMTQSLATLKIPGMGIRH